MKKMSLFCEKYNRVFACINYHVAIELEEIVEELTARIVNGFGISAIITHRDAPAVKCKTDDAGYCHRMAGRCCAENL